MKGRKIVCYVILLLLSSVWELKAAFINDGKESSLKTGEDFVALEVVDNLEKASIKVFHKLELQTKLPVKFNNPYDPGEIELYGLFIGPDNREYRIPGFFYQPFLRKAVKDKESYHPLNGGEWRVRFTPNKPGEWSYQLIAEYSGAKIQTDSKTFTVRSGERPGFVRVAPGNTGYFSFDNGQPFLPIGSNVAWYDGRGMIAYEKWFSKMAENGSNYARIWLAPWGFAPEWTDTGLGGYHNRQLQAWQLDYLFELSEKHGIYLMLCLINHGQFSTDTDAEWVHNPYNIENGGFLKEPVEFLTDPRAKELFKRKLRYIVARWGYSVNLFSWEWFNEVNLTAGLGDGSLLTPWMEEMESYLRTIDPYGRLVSNSYSCSYRGDEPEWTTRAVDYLQIHQYNQFNWSKAWRQTISDLRGGSSKPILIGEYGLQSMVNDPQGIHFHEGLWAGIFAGSAGTGMIWWWDTFLEPNNLYYHFKGVSRFMEGETLHQGRLRPIQLVDNEQLLGYGLVGDSKALVWARSKKYNHRYFENAARKIGSSFVRFPKVSGIIQVPGLVPGQYQVEMWDTIKGKIIKSKVRQLDEGNFLLELPKFKKDLAFKIYRL